jgi:Cys-tRNA(Pro)/Cys-tRNA(Cys) deacylase
MKTSPTKTNAVRVLDRAGVRYELRQYELAAEDFSAEAVAVLLGMATETIFKTLLAHGDVIGHLFALVPASSELDLRTLATASGNKRVELAPQRELFDLTGYMRGAVTPLAAKKSYPVYIDDTSELWPQIGISGGMRGLQIILAPTDLLRVSGAQLANIAR